MPFVNEEYRRPRVENKWKSHVMLHSLQLLGRTVRIKLAPPLQPLIFLTGDISTPFDRVQCRFEKGSGGLNAKSQTSVKRRIIKKKCLLNYSHYSIDYIAKIHGFALFIGHLLLRPGYARLCYLCQWMKRMFHYFYFIPHGLSHLIGRMWRPNSTGLEKSSFIYTVLSM